MVRINFWAAICNNSDAGGNQNRHRHRHERKRCRAIHGEPRCDGRFQRRRADRRRTVAEVPYAEQFVVWNLGNAPRISALVKLTTSDRLKFSGFLRPAQGVDVIEEVDIGTECR